MWKFNVGVYTAAKFCKPEPTTTFIGILLLTILNPTSVIFATVPHHIASQPRVTVVVFSFPLYPYTILSTNKSATITDILKYDLAEKNT